MRKYCRSHPTHHHNKTITTTPAVAATEQLYSEMELIIIYLDTSEILKTPKTNKRNLHCQNN